MHKNIQRSSHSGLRCRHSCKTSNLILLLAKLALEKISIFGIKLPPLNKIPPKCADANRLQR